MECIICYEDVSHNDFIIFDCCQQTTHINCLQNWVLYNLHSNSDISLCIYCKTHNIYIHNIIHSSPFHPIPQPTFTLHTHIYIFAYFIIVFFSSSVIALFVLYY